MVNSFPSISIDHSSSHPGRAYVTWCGQDAKGRVRVFLSTSDDDGTHWSSPRDVDGDTSSNPTDKFFSWVGVDPQNGNVAIDFNDSRSDPDNILSDIFMAFSTDGGDSFSVRRISDASSDSRAGDPFDQREVDGTYFQFFGDYIGIAGQSDRWYPAWTDCRSGDTPDIYTAIVEPFAPMPVSNLVALDTVIGGKQETLLTWEYKSETTFGYPLPAGYQFDLTNDGTHIHMLPSGNTSYLDTNAAASNEYGVTVLSGKYRSTTDSVRSGTSFVILRADKSSPAIRLSKSPAIAGRQEILSFQSTRQGTVVLSLYNELGQMMGAPMDDRGTGFAHEFRFTPVTPGVRFYLLQETTESGASEMAGKFVVTPE